MQAVCARTQRTGASHFGEIALPGSRCLRSTLVAALVLFAHAVVTVAKSRASATPTGKRSSSSSIKQHCDPNYSMTMQAKAAGIDKLPVMSGQQLLWPCLSLLSTRSEHTFDVQRQRRVLGASRLHTLTSANSKAQHNLMRPSRCTQANVSYHCFQLAS